MVAVYCSYVATMALNSRICAAIEARAPCIISCAALMLRFVINDAFLLTGCALPKPLIAAGHMQHKFSLRCSISRSDQKELDLSVCS